MILKLLKQEIQDTFNSPNRLMSKDLEQKSAENTRHHTAVIVALSFIYTITFIFLVVYASVGVSGSDQYWYLHDIEQLLAGNKPTTNTYWAGSFYRSSDTASPQYFIHHNAVLYLVLPLAHLLGAYSGWITTGIIMVILTGICIGYTLWVLTKNKMLAFLGHCLFLALPLTFWQSANMLQESILGSFAGICFTLLIIGIFKESIPLIITGLFFTITGIWMHPFFVMLSIFFLLFLLWACIKNQVKTGSIFLCLLTCGGFAGIFFMFIYSKKLFPSSGMPTISAIIQEHIPGKGNSAWHMYYDVVPVTVNLLTTKAADAILKQFQISLELLFRLPTNILAFLCLLGVWRFRKTKFRFLFTAIVCLIAIYAALICIHQNQFRTLFLITPALVIGGVIVPGSTKWKGSAVCFAAAALCFASLLPDYYLAHHLRLRSAKQNIQVKYIQQATAQVRKPVLIPYLVQHVIYALSPQPVMVFSPSLADDPRSKNVICSFKPGNVIAPRSASTNWIHKLPVTITGIQHIQGTPWSLINITTNTDTCDIYGRNRDF